MRCLNTLLAIIAVFIGIILLSIIISLMVLDREIYIIPEGYQGCALIVFDVEGGAKEMYDEYNNRVYELPPNGILETEFSADYGTGLPSKFYTRNEQGDLEEVKYVNPGEWNNQHPDTAMVVSTLEYGESYKPWESFVVRRYKSEPLCERRHDEHFEYLKKFKEKL